MREGSGEGYSAYLFFKSPMQKLAQSARARHGEVVEERAPSSILPRKAGEEAGKRMKSIGSVEVPQEAFMAVLDQGE